MKQASASFRDWRPWRSLTACAALLAFGVGIARAADPVPTVVLVSTGPFIAGSDAAEREYAYRIDAAAYAAWLTRVTGQTWRLPDELEWEKAARGTDGRYYPWGNEFDPNRLNSHDAGPFDTTPAGRYPAGPFGLLDAAGQVFEWTTTYDGASRAIVKGGSWDDKGCGVCRPAARHSRPVELKHILIGFRLVRE